MTYKPVTIAKDTRKELLKLLKEKPVLTPQEVREILDILMEKTIA